MRRAVNLIKAARDNGRRRAVLSNAAQRNRRLAGALNQVAEKDYLVFELATRNPRTDQLHFIEIWHRAYAGTDRYSVYLDGDPWRNEWSRTRFANWIFKQIDSVRRDFE